MVKIIYSLHVEISIHKQLAVRNSKKEQHQAKEKYA